MKIAYIFNNHTWSSTPEKILNITKFFAPSVVIESTTFNTYFTSIPFVTVPTSDGHQGAQDTPGTAETVDSQWFTTNIVPFASGADVIIFCLSKEDCIGHVTPTGIDDKNHIVMFGMDENNHAYVNGKDLGNEFELFCEHEISHYLFYVRGLVDRTHEFFYAGNPQGVLPLLQVNNKTTFQKLLDLFKQLFTLTQPPMQPTITSKLYDVALPLKGQYLTLDTSVPKGFNCAETMSYIFKQCGYTMPEKGYAGTDALYTWLQANMTKIPAPEFGCVIISVTQGDNHGHVGIVGHEAILSNDSQTGTLESYWNLAGWTQFYAVQKKLVTKYFKP